MVNFHSAVSGQRAGRSNPAAERGWGCLFRLKGAGEAGKIELTRISVSAPKTFYKQTV